MKLAREFENNPINPIEIIASITIIIIFNHDEW